MKTPPAVRGRPRIGDPDAISRIALDLMTAKGWTATTMQEIADEAGISAPTLFRYFPSKATLLWYGMDASARRFRDEFDLRRESLPLPDAVCTAYLAMLRSDEFRLRLIRSRLTIMERDEEAAAASSPRAAEWRELVTQFVGEDPAAPADPLTIRILGGMIWTALSTALSAWAVSDELDPGSFIAAARSCLPDELFS